MKDQIKAHAPIIGLAFLAAGLFVAQNRGWLTSMQVEWLLATCGIAAGKAQLHITPPGKEAS